jgi:N-methylhydantoinase A
MPSRAVFISGAWRETAVYRAGGLAAEIRGPAIIEEAYTTIFIAQGWRCGPGERGTLVAIREAGDE